MGETSKDVLALLTQLMPGFLTAWVVYGLTTYTKPPHVDADAFLTQRADFDCPWRSPLNPALGQRLRGIGVG